MFQKAMDILQFQLQIHKFKQDIQQFGVNFKPKGVTIHSNIKLKSHKSITFGLQIQQNIDIFELKCNTMAHKFSRTCINTNTFQLKSKLRMEICNTKMKPRPQTSNISKPNTNTFTQTHNTNQLN